ncbi:hypothetical protein LXL04_021293 [Taraxacum kok-saghyz]
MSGIRYRFLTVSSFTVSHSSTKFSVRFNVSCCISSSPVTIVNGNVDVKSADRNEIRLGLPSKGRMATDTLDLLKDCQLSVRQLNPRQYVADIPQLSNVEVWFQPPKDIVRKLVSGDLDLGIVGLDIVSEFGQGNEDLVLVHDELAYGDCRLSLAIPKYGIFEKINSVKELAQMPQRTAEKPLRVATGNSRWVHAMEWSGKKEFGSSAETVLNTKKFMELGHSFNGTWNFTQYAKSFSVGSP